LEGYRHPVVLYDGIKNLLLIPFLIMIRNTNPPRGVITAHFILWYGFLRIFVDFFREYRTDFYGFPPGQEFNIFMTLTGSAMLIYFYRKKSVPHPQTIQWLANGNHNLWLRRVIFALLLFFPTVIPSDWTQDVPERYGKRHDGLTHSAIYPRIDVGQRENASSETE